MTHPPRRRCARALVVTTIALTLAASGLGGAGSAGGAGSGGGGVRATAVSSAEGQGAIAGGAAISEDTATTVSFSPGAGPADEGEPGRVAPDNPATGQRWWWPVGPEHRLTRGYAAPATHYSSGHRGIDIAAAASQPVAAVDDGVVAFVGIVVDRPVITLAHRGGYLSSIEPVSSSLVIGAVVKQGQQIGTVAVGGHCSDSCVHLGARLRREYISPLMMLDGIPRARLLPWTIRNGSIRW